jgi:hypothetical protein
MSKGFRIYACVTNILKNVQDQEDLDQELSRKVKDMSLHVHKLDRRRGPAGSFSVSRYVKGIHPPAPRLLLTRILREICKSSESTQESCFLLDGDRILRKPQRYGLCRLAREHTAPGVVISGAF